MISKQLDERNEAPLRLQHSSVAPRRLQSICTPPKKSFYYIIPENWKWCPELLYDYYYCLLFFFYFSAKHCWVEFRPIPELNFEIAWNSCFNLNWITFQFQARCPWIFFWGVPEVVEQCFSVKPVAAVGYMAGGGCLEWPVTYPVLP